MMAKRLLELAASTALVVAVAAVAAVMIVYQREQRRLNRALADAIARHDSASVAVLLWRGASPATRDPHGTTALMIAAWDGNLDLASRLAYPGPGINARDADGSSALTYAVNGGQTEVAKLLLSRGADPNIRDRAGDTLLMQSVEADQSAMARLLIDSGADLNVRDLLGRTAVSLAMERGRYAPALLLLRRGATVSRVASVRREIMQKLAERRQHLIRERRANHRGRVLARRAEQRRKRLIAGLFDALEHRDGARAERLLQAGADATASRADGATVLMAAVRNCRPPVVDVLLADGAALEARDAQGRTALMWAADAGRLDTFERLLAAGADLHVRDRQGHTALALAAASGQARAAHRLKELSHVRPAPGEKSQGRETPLPPSRGQFLSPDRQYLFRTWVGQAEVRHLVIYRVRRVIRGQPERGEALCSFFDVDGFMWVPRRPHSLIVAVANCYADRARLALWSGGRRSRTLLPRPPSRGSWRNGGQWFGLFGCTADGKTAVFSYARDPISGRTSDESWTKQQALKRYLRLPG